ncbi:MAG: mismatch repair protein [Acidobacteriota bacterium]|nr:mismatch repair protein [Acidobacteriota bacterium]
MERSHLRFGNLRLLLVIAALVAAWFSLHGELYSAWWLVVFPVLFVGLAAMHANVLRRRTATERAAEFYSRGLARMEDRWAGVGSTGERIDAAASLYASDLDLFGQGSLFQLLSLARTQMGEDTLAGWLLQASSAAQILERQTAVAELRTSLDLREDVAVLDEDLRVGVHPARLMEWAEARDRLGPEWMRWVARVLAVAAGGAAIYWAETGQKAAFFLIVAGEALLTAALRKQSAGMLNTAEHAHKDLKLLASMLARLERERFVCPRLEAIEAGLTSQRVAGSEAIGRLGTIVELIHSRENPAMRLLDIPLLYTVQIAFAADAWRKAHGTAVRGWLDAVGEMEALLSLAGYSYEHPADPFPEIAEGAPCFAATGLGHPLLPSATCVRNDMRLCGETKVVLISGSNMSGKSTLMRAVGINTVLAMAGAPVRAAGLQLTPLHIGASILINDSLQEGSSRFYAEITRLREICALAEERSVLFLMDELLQGTNSSDRLVGAEGLVRALLASGAIGLISTHDLALTGIGGDADSRLRNVHLQDFIEDGRMKFDFKLQDGVVTKSNGIELMRLIGLKV